MSNIRLVAVLFSASLLSMLAFGLRDNEASALSGSQFNAGNIIADSLFYNGNTLTTNQIQSFLNSKVPSCNTYHARSSSSNDPGPPYTCLKSYRQSTPNRAANSYCGAYTGGTKNAAQIINDVAAACKISEKVLIVMLEKEQSLVTDTWPWPIQYRSAMGYGCPDTAPCDSEYYGFFNQVYNAAKQFNRYKLDGSSFNYQGGKRSYIQWHPNTSCGGSYVTIQNHATAGLYNYTPYRPNGSALANLYGTGNSCSSYGNRNFWRLYNDWFGSTTGKSDTLITGDWNNDSASIGVKRSSLYYLDYDRDGSTDNRFYFGRSTDRTLVGDWDGDGKSSIGLKRDNRYYLDFNNDGVADKSFSVGRASDGLMVGDWDGDGKSSIGLKRDNRYYLDFNNDGVIDKSLQFGRSTDRTLVGDWDGDGKSSIGLKRDNRYYLDFNNDGVANTNFIYGRSTDRTLVGDWDGNNTQTIGIKRDATYYLSNNFDSHGENIFSYGWSEDRPLIGDWDGDGDDSIGLKRVNFYFLDNNFDGGTDINFQYGY